MRRELRSPRGKHGSLADSIGHARAQQIAAAFLAIRPEGGRVYIDADGDAATPGPDGLMYLGNINEAQDPDLSVAQR